MRSSPALFIACLLLVVTCIGCASSEPERSREPWIIRSVLDDRPRMVTLALHDALWASYDTETGAIYKVWSDSVKFDGAVYTTAHGPQPTTVGDAYLVSSHREPWIVLQNGNEVQPAVQYRGHRVEDGRAILRYELRMDTGRVITVDESPEYVVDEEGRPGLERVYTATDVPEGARVALKMHLHSLPSPDSYETDGQFEPGPASEMIVSDASVFTRDGRLILNESGTTRFTTHFHPQPMVPFDAPTADKDKHPGLALIETSDCHACHNAQMQTVGPSYQDIADRYEPVRSNITMLVDKIIQGGTGNWSEQVGAAVMTPHPDLSPDAAEKMIDYIFSLGEASADGEEQEEAMSLRQRRLDKGPAYSIVPSGGAAEGGEGLAVNIYRYSRLEEMPEPAADELPVYSGVVRAIHAPDRSDFGPLRRHFYIEAKGYIDVSRTDNYVFRLISDDGSILMIDGDVLIDHGGTHTATPKDGEVYLEQGRYPIAVHYFQGGGSRALSLQWIAHGEEEFMVVPPEVLSYEEADLKETAPYVPPEPRIIGIPGDGRPLIGVHPSFDLATVRPPGFEPRVGGLDVLPDGRLAVSTWEPDGPVYLLDNLDAEDRDDIEVKRIASGLHEPLGLKVVDGDIYVMQKQELTRLIDHDGDDVIDEYRTVANDWGATSNFHEFGFGLAYEDGHFYATLATAVNPGGASTQPQDPDRGSALKIAKEDGAVEFVANGLRTPNGIGFGVDGELFIADNQGDWLPASKIVHLQKGAWYGSRSVDFEGTAGMEETPPVVWLPQNEIGNSPTQPAPLDVGPYENQMIHGDVTHGGLKRVFVEDVGGQYQGAVFRFSQGLEAGVNRLMWGPDGRLYIGGVGNPGNWSQRRKNWFGLQRFSYNGESAFEMLAVRAKTNGLEIEFTEPLQVNDGFEEDDYLIKQWWYKPTEKYGGPKMDEEELSIRSVHVSEDRRRVFLEVDGMQEGHVVYVRLREPFISRDGGELWTTEAWYTLNRIPENAPGFVSDVTYEKKRHNSLTEAEREEGWRLLFDGETTDGWRGYLREDVPSAWHVEDGTLTYVPGSGERGDIMTEEEYEDFELRLEWRISPGGNSGILYNVVESPEYAKTWHTGSEMQVLDNARHADGKIEKHRAGDLYDLIESRFDATRPVGEWNEVRIIQNDGHVEHWLNGHEVLEYEWGTDEWDQLVANSKFSDMPGYGRASKGHIALQDHRDRVWFRSIKLRPLE